MQSKKLIAEFVGTFALVFVGAGAAAVGVAGVEGVALAHGLILMALVYAFGGLSGAHVNPAVTFGIWLRGEIDLGEGAAYVIVQLIGGVVAGFLLLFLLAGPVNQVGATVLRDDMTAIRGLILEAVMTFFLVTAVFRAAVRGTAGGSAAVAIGVTLAAAILIGGPLTGASLNPARTLGPAVAIGDLSQIWVYFVGTALGGALAAGLDWTLERP